MTGVFLDRDSLEHDDLDFSPLLATLPEWQFHADTHAEQTAARIAGAEVVVSNKVMLAQCPGGPAQPGRLALEALLPQVDIQSKEPPSLLQQSPPNLIVTPHIAWASRQSRQRLLNQLAENIAAFLTGKAQNIVTDH